MTLARSIQRKEEQMYFACIVCKHNLHSDVDYTVSIIYMGLNKRLRIYIRDGCFDQNNIT